MDGLAEIVVFGIQSTKSLVFTTGGIYSADGVISVSVLTVYIRG
jgi:hypothetical protein